MQKTSGAAFGCWLLGLVGACGIHRMYLGFWATGLLWFFTLGLLGVGQLIDLFRLRGLVIMSNSQLGGYGGGQNYNHNTVAPIINVNISHPSGGGYPDVRTSPFVEKAGP